MDIPCDDCRQPCGIFICTGCYEKVKHSLVPGLKKALEIVENRRRTGTILGASKEYLAAFDDIKIFLDAELWRQENPKEAALTATLLD